ncbi:hypothetical protein ASC68_08720 [Devosia sp. Root105]|nr:hypothetical protein ASC68_08720 [Devosia sp. Root105]
MVTVVINGRPMLVPDTTSEAFRRQAREDSLTIANSPSEAEDQAFIDSMQEWGNPESDDWWDDNLTVPDEPTNKTGS